MKRKIISLVLLSILTLSISACSSSEADNIEPTTEESVSKNADVSKRTTPENSVTTFFDAFKTNYFETMNECLADGTVPFSSTAVTKTQSTNAAVDAMTQNLEYKIKNTQISDDGIEAFVEVELTNVAISSIMTDIVSDIMDEIPLLPDEQKQTLNIDARMAEEITKRTAEENSPKKVVSTIKVNLLKSNENWDIVASEDLYNAMTGDYISFQRMQETFTDSDQETVSESENE